MLFGVDVGTTAVKCALVSASSADHELLAASYVALDKVPLGSTAAAQRRAVQGEQDVEQVLRAVHKAITALPVELCEQITLIGICGQVSTMCVLLVVCSCSGLDKEADWTVWCDGRCTGSCGGVALQCTRMCKNSSPLVLNKVDPS